MPKTETKADKATAIEKAEHERHEMPARRFLDWLGWPALGPRFESLGFFEERDLRVEEFDDKQAFVVRVEAPGLDPDKDLDIHVTDHTLHISAKREEKEEHRDKEHYRSEFRYGSYLRTLRLPAGAKSSDVEATYKDGILEVRVPIDDEVVATSKVPVHRA